MFTVVNIPFLCVFNIAGGLRLEARAHQRAHRHTITTLISLFGGINVITGDLYCLRYK